jgi:[acyl-carrier-protein] S-malonyltransferase
MASARERLQTAIEGTSILQPICAVYQNVDAVPTEDPAQIKQNLMAQLTAPVRWTQTMRQMIDDGVLEFVEVGGKGRILCGLLRRISRDVAAESV